MEFEAGEISISPGAVELSNMLATPLYEYLDRHLNGDWGIIDPEDAEDNWWNLNEARDGEGGRVMSVYNLENDRLLVIVTDLGDGTTDIMLHSEYVESY